MFGPDIAEPNVAYEKKAIESAKMDSFKNSNVKAVYSNKPVIIPKINLEEKPLESPKPNFYIKDEEGNSKFIFKEPEERSSGTSSKQKRKDSISKSEKRHIHLLNPGSGEDVRNYRKK